MDVIILDMGDAPKGESNITGFKDKIELLSFSHGVAMQITGDVSNSERTSGKPNHQDLTVTKYLDAASPVLNQSCCEGKVNPKVDLIIGRNDGGTVVELMRYTIKSALISSVSIGGGGGDKPVETLTFNYNQIAWNFTSQKEEGGKEGNVPGMWNLATNKAE